MKIEGNMRWAGEKAQAILREIMLEGLLDAAGKIESLAKNNAPLETGALRNSCRITIGALPDPVETYKEAQCGVTGDTPIAGDGSSVVYMSFHTPYARRLHEDLTWNPRPYKILYRGRDPVTGHRIRKIVDKRPVGGPKYLERALEAVRPDCERYIKKRFARHGIKMS